MARIRNKNTRPEVALRKALWAAGIRYRIHCKDLPGKPDIANKRLKFAIFVDGEFWHGHDWEVKKHHIKSNQGFWIPKIERNMQRDEVVNHQLRAMGFQVFRFWQQEVKKEPGACLKQVLDYIGSKENYQYET